MDKKEQYKELIECFEDIFQEISIDGLKNSTVPKIESLLDTTCKIYDYSLYFNPTIISTIFLLEHLNCSNTLINVSISQFKLNAIKLQIENFENTFSNNTEINTITDIVETEQKIEYINKTVDINDLFVETPTGRKVKDESKIPPIGSIAKLRLLRNASDETFGVEYTINDKGYVLYEEKLDEDFSLDNINYDEIYIDEIEDALKYQDMEKATEEDLE